MKVFFTVLLALLADGFSAVEAKSIGNGMSFDGQIISTQALQQYPAQLQAASALKQNDLRKQQLSQTGGFMGMFGAMALGGLLGTIFFDGAFEGVNLLDILIFGLVFLLFLKMMTRKSHVAVDTVPAYIDVSQNARTTGDSHAVYPDDLRGVVPEGFNQEDFINEAKSYFVRLQKSWGEGDLADIRQFITVQAFGEIQSRMHSRGRHVQTELVSLEAELLSVDASSDKQAAIVLFNCQAKGNDQQYVIEEVWHFINSTNCQKSSWFLDDIQQVVA